MSRRAERAASVTRAVETALAIEDWVWSDARSVRVEAALAGFDQPGRIDDVVSLVRIKSRLGGDFEAALAFAQAEPALAAWVVSPDRLVVLEMRVGARLAGGPVRNFVTRADIDAFIAVAGTDVWERCLAGADSNSGTAAGADPVRIARHIAREGRRTVMSLIHALAPTLAEAIRDSGLAGWEGEEFGGTLNDDVVAVVLDLAGAGQP